MFEKLDEYLVNIYMNQELDNNFNIFKMDSKKSYSLNGFLDSDNAYMLYRKNNSFGLRINNGQYLFFYSREKYINSEDFRDILENDSEYDEDELIEKYKNVDYVVLGENNQQTKTGQTISFLVNKSSYLVTDYFKKYKDNSSISVSYDKSLLNSEELNKIRIFNPLIPNFNISKQKKGSVVVLISKDFHESFIIKENMKESNNLFFREKLIQKVSNEAVEADRRSYTIIKDFDECAEKLNKIINQRFGNDLDPR